MASRRVIVVHPPVSVARDFIDYPYVSDLGAVQLAAVLRDCGFDVALVDGFAMPGSGLAWRDDGRALLGAPVVDVVAAIRGAGAADAIVVAYSPFHRPPHRDSMLAAVLQGIDAPIVLADCYQSGQHYVEATGDSVRAAYPEIAAWVKYEAEVTVPALLDSGELTGVHRGARPELDALPFPAWDLVDLDAYARFHDRVVANLGRGGWAFPIGGGRTLPMVTSRGCPFVCVHCSSNPDLVDGEPHTQTKTQRRYPAERLRAYVRELVERHGAARLYVLDELVNVNERHFDALLDEASARDVRFEIPNGMRADYLEPRHLAAMRGRVSTVSVSAESGSQRVVTEVVRKRLDLAHIEAAARNAHEAGVALMIHFMIGLPGETAAEVNETLAFAMDLFDRYGAFPAVQYATPLPGTQLAGGRSSSLASSLALPVVEDWGPRFQMQPSQPDALVPAAELQKFKWTFDQRLRAAAAPAKLIMNVTYVCNNHCTFCAVGTRTQIHGHPTRQREHLDKYRGMGVKMVDFDGGEPTLNPELVPLIRYARRIGYDRINVTTNGRMCFYPEFAERLVRSGLTTLLFSVHGHDAQSHAQQVGVAEAFEQTTSGIRNCVAAAPAGVELGMNITVTKGNHDKQEQLAQLCWDLGLRWLNIQFLTPFGRATKMVAPDTQVAADCSMRLIDRWNDRLKIQIINLPFCFMPGYESHMMGDLLKLQRHMIFVNNEDVNLADYLAERRTRKPVCEPCPHAVFCGGFYELEKVPEPPWLIATDDLLREVRPAPPPKATLHLIDS
jgi:MoaA/NifB/PqqE/SkfB family radical SAM enzyme